MGLSRYKTSAQVLSTRFQPVLAVLSTSPGMADLRWSVHAPGPTQSRHALLATTVSLLIVYGRTVGELKRLLALNMARVVREIPVSANLPEPVGLALLQV